jgi:hypothetical protein
MALIDSELVERIKNVLPLLDEKQRRLYLASEAKELGYGGISKISQISGVSRVTITLGMAEIESEVNKPNTQSRSRSRKVGGGRKLIEIKHPDFLPTLETLLEPHTKGDPMNPLKWTSKSLRKLEAALAEKGYDVAASTIAGKLKEMGYSLQLNRKELALKPSHPDRDAQFEYINKTAKDYINANQPVISVDAKKKENIGNFKNNGAEYSKKKEPVKVLDHDFPIEELGKAVPYGVYDLMNNTGFINVGISKDTAEFAVMSIKKWWYLMGQKTYSKANKMYITADGGGSNGSTVKLWKTELQAMANELGLKLQISHFPPGTSKWNKIEHKLFSFISKNWRGKPLTCLEVIVNLIASTTTSAGLKIQCVVDYTDYKSGVKVTDDELAKVNITRDEYHGDWNYSITPNI